MCGRYVLALRYGQVQRVLDDHGLPTGNFQQGRGGRTGRGRDYWGDGAGGDEAGEGGGKAEADGSADADTSADADADDSYDAIFRPSYNFAPGFHGIVIRPVRNVSEKDDEKEDKDEMDGKDASEGGITEEIGNEEQPTYQLQVMKWGLVPSWMHKRPDHASVLKTINCRSDSLVGGSGMWAGLRSRKRCVVVASGFYEWLRTGPNGKERVPHYIRRRDGLPLLMAGLWDCAALEDGASTDMDTYTDTYTYTIVTTDSNATLRFLHDRMPVVFDYGSRALAAWLDKDRAWSAELGRLLKPWPVEAPDLGGSLLVDVVGKEVNKAGHSSPSLIVPVASAANKSNIANFFKERDGPTTPKKANTAKRATDEEPEPSPQPIKKTKVEASPAKMPPTLSKPSSPAKMKPPGKAVKAARASGASGHGSQKITSFFSKG